MKARANRAILEQERKEKERLANSARLTMIRIDLVHSEGEDFTFKDAICSKYNINTNTDSSDVFERFAQEFYRGLDRDEFVIPFSEKKKGITIYKKDSNQIQNNTSQTLTEDEVEKRILWHKSTNILEGIICGGAFGRPRNARQLKNKNENKDVNSDDVVTDDYYIYLYLPMDYNIGYLLLQYYPDITIKNELIKYIKSIIKTKKGKFKIETSYYDDEDLKQQFKENCIVDHLIFSETFIKGDTIDEKDGISEKQVGGIKLKLEVSSIDDKPIEYSESYNFLDRISKHLFLNKKSTKKFQEKKLTLKNTNTGKTTTVEIDGDFKIRPAVILCEEITVDDTGIPNFSELKKFCAAKMEEIKEKTFPGYKKQVL